MVMFCRLFKTDDDVARRRLDDVVLNICSVYTFLYNRYNCLECNRLSSSRSDFGKVLTSLRICVEVKATTQTCHASKHPWSQLAKGQAL